MDGFRSESISAVGPKPDIKISFTLAKHKINLLSIRVGTNTVPTLPGCGGKSNGLAQQRLGQNLPRLIEKNAAF
ncbi:hypothetical protein [Methylomonas sp. CM2]|uniref:hypothetical protein n=1 Tax=Methylomonas sp. CM2 TaxID=3417647 RepID=UPI003CECBE10